MTALTSPTNPQPEPETPRADRVATSEWAIVAGLYLIAIAVYVALSRKQPIPLIQPDEYTYGGAAWSLAHGHGLEVLGEPANLKAALYVYLITPAWWLGSAVSAYTGAKAIGTAVLCLTILPVWWLARQFTGRWVALVPAVLVVAGTWMTAAASLLTETVALPLSAAALTAAVMGLRRPGSWWFWWALGFSALATWARMQMGVLFAVLLIAIVLDATVLRPRHKWRTGLDRHRRPLIALGTLIVVGGIVALAGGRSTLGFYESVTNFSPTAGDVAEQVWRQLIALTVMTAMVPMALAIAAAASPAAWRDDDRLRPLLCVGLTAVVVFVVQSAWFNAGIGAPHAVQRYVVYAAPMLLVIAVVMPVANLVPLRTAAIAGGCVALLGFATPAVAKVIEERGVYGLWLRVGDTLGASAGVAVGLVALVAVGVALALLWRARPPIAALGVGAVVLSVLLVQSQAGWTWQLDITRAFRAQFPSLTWLDGHTGPDTTRLFGFINSPLTDTVEFFNHDVSQTLIPPDGYEGRAARGKQCDLNIGQDGVVRIDPPCDPTPAAVWNNDPLLRVAFANGRQTARQPLLGQVFRLDGGPPRLLAGIVLPCAPPTLSIAKNGARFGPANPAEVSCRDKLQASTFLRQPGTLSVTFRGGRDSHRVQADGRVVEIPPGATETVRIRVPAGAQQIQVPTDWTTAEGAPQIVGISLQSGTSSVPIL